MLAGWSSWGAIPQIFDPARDEWAGERAELRDLLSEAEWNAARRTTINAHYTDPGIAAAMWSTLTELGLSGGQVLEPGSGSGTFIGLAPDTVAMTGVELDPVTVGIARGLYPQAQIRTESFANTTAPAGTFDAAVGNVPFADVVLHDKAHNANRHSIHNHFILKSLDLVRPGGMVAVLTSAYTLDATNPAARREMYGKADLVGAVRLPTGAHRRTAGTEALTDLVIFRRREVGQEPGDDSWLRTHPVRIDGELRDRRMNAYFGEHPERVLGTVDLAHGMHSAETLMVRSENLEAVPAQLSAALRTITEQARTAGLTVTERPPDLGVGGIPTAPATGTWLGVVTAHPVEGFEVIEAQGSVPIAVPKTQHQELRALLSMRDMTRDLLQQEAASVDTTAGMSDLRTRLRATYEGYTAQFGPINRYTLSSTGKFDEETGELIYSRNKPPVMRFLRRDPFGSLVRALEMFDEESQRAVPAAILSERVVLPRTPLMGADTPEDAVAIALDTDGRLELDRIAELLGIEPEAARQRLGTLVFDDPATGRLVTRAEYLSGNVREKLDAARTSADAGDSAMQVNVDALTQVIPEPLGPADITPRIGAAWISTADHQQFLRELITDPRAQVQSIDGSIWAVRANRSSIAATGEWGTPRRPAGMLFQAVLEQQQIKVDDTMDDGSKIINTTETEAAREKATAIQERFAEWLWEDPERAERLADEYNRLFNSLVLRDYTADGERLSLPGIAATWSPRPHQRGAVARMLSEPSVGLFHQVGAGKTGEMVMGAMELKRLGMVHKPVVVVPDHMLEQFSREWLQIYPRARLLAAGSDDVKASQKHGWDRRPELVARIATGDWDGIVITHGAFNRIEVSPEAQAAYLQREVGRYRAALDAAAETDQDLTVKKLEKKLAKAEEKVKAKLDAPRDPGITFEATGIDYVIVDEAHLYKNLSTVSNITDANIEGSRRAQDLHMKLELLRARHGERIATLATATPIANSISEAHVMSRYLRPDLLRAAGVEPFDTWAATFGETVTELELSAAGTEYRPKTRFARFQNVPEMLRMWATFADVKTAEDLNLPTPLLRERPDGQRLPITVTVPPTPELVEFVESLDARAKNLSSGWQPEKGGDNLLKIIGEGRHAALDVRLVGMSEPTGPTKITAAADRIAAIWRDNIDREYLDATGTQSPTKGAFQLVFSDLSTPKPDRFNVYSEMKSLLIERGMPAQAIRFIHDAEKPTDKARLFAACRSGEVAVLIGSTGKMGVGTNIQARAIALHHLDAPWRPADLEQRDGRVVRQYNQNPEVEVYRWTTARSFDTFMWQTLERKQKFITQVLRGRLDVREIDDVGDVSMNLGETKAVTADDPLILDKANADQRLAKLERLERAHQQQTGMLRHRIAGAQMNINHIDALEPTLTALIEQSTATAGDAFAMTIDNHRYTDRVDAQRALRDTLMTHAVPRAYSDRKLPVKIEIGGHRIGVQQVPTTNVAPQFSASISGLPNRATVILGDSLGNGVGVVRTFENAITSMPQQLDAIRNERASAQSVQVEARATMERPFKHSDELTDARAEAARINALIAERATPTPIPPSGPETAVPTTEALAEAQEAARLSGLGRSSTGHPSLPDHDVGEHREMAAANLPKPQRPGGRSI